MRDSTSSWFGWPKEEQSASERARQTAKRKSGLEQHMLRGGSEPSAGTATGTTPRRTPARIEQRDPLEFESGIDVNVLSESAFGNLFPQAAPDPP